MGPLILKQCDESAGGRVFVGYLHHGPVKDHIERLRDYVGECFARISVGNDVIYSWEKGDIAYSWTDPKKRGMLVVTGRGKEAIKIAVAEVVGSLGLTLTE